MWAILQRRGLRYVFLANVISMLGSGMNAAAVAWHILQTTHSEVSLGYLTLAQTLPAMLMLPFTGVIIDREDRRRLVMWLDAGRALVILAVSILALQGRTQLWQLYVMVMLVSAGFWMFWPAVTALIQELTPNDEYVQANTFLLAGVQGGWLIAGAIVGFTYEHIGLGGVLLIDVSTYVLSFLCYFAVRKGHHAVPRPEELKHDLEAAESAAVRFVREMKDGVDFVRQHPRVALLGSSWALFLGAMLTGYVVTPSLSDHVLHAGAKGYGWLNMGWGVGAFLSALYAPQIIKKLGPRGAIAVSMGALALGSLVSPYMRWVTAAVAAYGLMGSARGVSGIAMNTGLMEQVPKHLMGRVQNIFNLFGSGLQVVLGLTVGNVAHRVGLAQAFAILAAVYLVALVSACWPAAGLVPKAADQ